MAGVIDLIWGWRKAKYFCRGGLDRWNRVDPVQQIRRLAHGRNAGEGAVARMERSEIRGRVVDIVVPDYAEFIVGRAFARPVGSIRAAVFGSSLGFARPHFL